jgi:hypothetical protein
MGVAHRVRFARTAFDLTRKTAVAATPCICARRPINILADEVVRLRLRWACMIIGGVLGAECSPLFEAQAV